MVSQYKTKKAQSFALGQRDWAIVRTTVDGNSRLLGIAHQRLWTTRAPDSPQN
jgi:hypothetical protein